MKYIAIALFLMSIGQRVNAQSTAAELLAQKIAGRMKDSLQLSDVQADQIYKVNLALHEQKKAVRARVYEPGELQLEIQKVERTRDSLYKEVLSEERYLMYKQKKTNLVNNN